jgi:hypothetical protein
MKVGCFALVDPFETLDHQLSRIADMGFDSDYCRSIPDRPHDCVRSDR